MRLRVFFLLSLAIAAVPFLIAQTGGRSAESIPTDELRIGDILPTLAGQSASGRPLALPTGDAGAYRVVVFTFQGASTDFGRWTQRLEKEAAPDHVLIYRVILLQSVPKLFRRMTVDTVRGGIPRTEWNRTLFLYSDDVAWRKRLAVKDVRDSYLVLIDGNGLVRWIGSGPFTEAAYGQLKALLAHAPSTGRLEGGTTRLAGS